MSSDAYSQRYRAIWATVRRIPYGKVATYGQVARIAGLEGQARQVGYALHAAPRDMELPWHRVINARGRISLPVESGHYDLQRSLLAAEGVVFHGETVDLSRYQWRCE